MICPKCLSEIPDDSSFCDQCGFKLLVCPSCGKPGTGKYCKVDNTRMIEKGAALFEKKFFKTERNPKAGGKVYLLLNNKNLNINIKIETGGVIGRKSEISLKELGEFKQISSKHALIEFKTGGGWFVTDLNSTNGTKINNNPLEAMKPAQIKPGDTLTLANIEFFVSQ
ncbi:FHA domain protein [bacterium BMS3Abin03]|nr:FHA domain protein [bacterium BMS3Abin03]